MVVRNPGPMSHRVGGRFFMPGDEYEIEERWARYAIASLGFVAVKPPAPVATPIGEGGLTTKPPTIKRK